MPRTLRSSAPALALVLATVVLGPAGLAAAQGVPAAPAPAGAPAPADESLMTVEDLEEQADELAQQVREQQAAVEAEQARLVSAEAAAAATLEDHQRAQREAETATRAAEDEARRLLVATARTDAARQRLSDYVGGLYRQGMHTERMSVYNSLLGSRGPEAFLTGLSLAERVGSSRGGEMAQLAQAELAQQEAERRAQAARLAATQATEAAAAAKQLADAVVDEARRAMLASTEVLLRTQGAAAAAAQKEADRRALMAKAEAIAKQRAAIPYAAIEGSLLPRPSADCLGQELRGYPNGRLPSHALCPLWGSSGQMLRADAAAAFNEMSRAYALVFGAPICITDSYRSYDEQVAVQALKPELAAAPGTSNHGWAMAVDLCDGVQDFGSPTHDWLRRNSLRYGWFLPAWAMPGGSKPEPWHWEFAG